MKVSEFDCSAQGACPRRLALRVDLKNRLGLPPLLSLAILRRTTFPCRVTGRLARSALAIGLGCAALLVAAGLPARAATLTWTGTDSNWPTAAGWGGTAPGAGDIAILNAGNPTETASTTISALQIGGTGNLNVAAGIKMTMNALTISGGKLKGSGTIDVGTGRSPSRAASSGSITSPPPPMTFRAAR